MENKRNHNPLGKTWDEIEKEKKSTRELASEWFSSKTYLEQHAFSDKYFGSRNPSLLTIEQVEEIWKKEFSYHTDEYFSKPNQRQIVDEIIDLVGEKQFKEIIKESEKRLNQKQYSQEEVDMLLDQQAARTTAQVLKNNTKQFKEFNPELFKSYIDKFSDEDKVRAMVVLLENQKEEYKFNCFLAALKQINLDSNTHSNIMTLVALKDI